MRRSNLWRKKAIWDSWTLSESLLRASRQLEQWDNGYDLELLRMLSDECLSVSTCVGVIHSQLFGKLATHFSRMDTWRMKLRPDLGDDHCPIWVK